MATIDIYTREQVRLRGLIVEYKQISSGALAVALIKAILERADEAALEGDLVRMAACLEEMRDCA